jgi:hypothetical protein
VNDCLPVHLHVFSFFIVSSISSFEILFTAYISEIIHLVLPAVQVFAVHFIIFSIVCKCLDSLFRCTSVGHHLYASVSMLFVRRGVAFYLDAQGSVFIVAFFS